MRGHRRGRRRTGRRPDPARGARRQLPPRARGDHEGVGGCRHPPGPAACLPVNLRRLLPDLSGRVRRPGAFPLPEPPGSGMAADRQLRRVDRVRAAGD